MNWARIIMEGRYGKDAGKGTDAQEWRNVRVFFISLIQLLRKLFRLFRVT